MAFHCQSITVLCSSGIKDLNMRHETLDFKTFNFWIFTVLLVEKVTFERKCCSKKCKECV